MESSDQNTKQAPWGIIVFIITLIVLAILAWQFLDKEQPAPTLEVEPVVSVEPEPVEEVQEPEAEPLPEPPEIIFPEPVEPEPVEKTPLPVLDESDTWVQENLSSLTWSSLKTYSIEPTEPSYAISNKKPVSGYSSKPMSKTASSR